MNFDKIQKTKNNFKFCYYNVFNHIFDNIGIFLWIKISI